MLPNRDEIKDAMRYLDGIYIRVRIPPWEKNTKHFSYFFTFHKHFDIDKIDEVYHFYTDESRNVRLKAKLKYPCAKNPLYIEIIYNRYRWYSKLFFYRIFITQDYQVFRNLTQPNLHNACYRKILECNLETSSLPFTVREDFDRYTKARKIYDEPLSPEFLSEYLVKYSPKLDRLQPLILALAP